MAVAESRQSHAGSQDICPKEYRIIGERVEARTFIPEDEAGRNTENDWWILTPDQLSDQVERNTAVAQWLERRMGWRALLRACVGENVWQSGTKHESHSANQ